MEYTKFGLLQGSFRVVMELLRATFVHLVNSDKNYVEW